MRSSPTGGCGRACVSCGSRRKARRCPTRYDELSSDVMTAANALPTHPGPLAHARRHIEALLAAGQEVLVYYEQAKREAGLVDYSDMIALAGRLLREQPAVLATLKSRVDCLVVDEFQDTNPLQFALVWQLAAAGVPTRGGGRSQAGDHGVPGRGPAAVRSACRSSTRTSASRSTKNWRSQPRLMAFVNALGPGLFGEEYIALAPQRTETEPVPLEVVSFTTKAKKDQHLVRAVAVGERFKALLEDSDADASSIGTRSRHGGSRAATSRCCVRRTTCWRSTRRCCARRGIGCGCRRTAGTPRARSRSRGTHSRISRTRRIDMRRCISRSPSSAR